MEHRNSTILSSESSLAQNAMRLLGTVSHEFFHSWNVERIRPAALEPFDFEDANMSADLWFAEGFTSYYTPLFIRRAGITNDAEFAEAIAGGLDFVINSPARNIFNPTEMSMQAPFADRASSSVDPLNFANTFISYYTWGSVVGLNLDLTLRGNGFSLDDFMKYVWEKHGKTEVPYAVAGLEIALAEYTGNAEFAAGFFATYVRHGEVPDYEKLLAQAGFLLRKQNPGQAFWGLANLRYEDDGASVRSNTMIGSPLYIAGIDRDDLIMKVDGKALTGIRVLKSLTEKHKSGDVIELVYEQRGVTKTSSLTFIEDPRLEVVLFEDAGRMLTEEQKKFRAAWLGKR